MAILFTVMQAASTSSLSILSQHLESSSSSSSSFPSSPSHTYFSKLNSLLTTRRCSKFSVLASSKPDGSINQQQSPISSSSSTTLLQPDEIRLGRRLADWKAARTYRETGSIFEGRIEGFNGGGFLVRFYSLVGFLPFPQLSPSHSCKEPGKSIHEVARSLNGSVVSVRVIEADEEHRRLIFSEKVAMWSIYSDRVKVGDIFSGRVGLVEDYGAFVHLRFSDGLHHLTGMVHISEVSWDLVHDVRDVLTEGDEVKVKVINVDRVKCRITLSIKQLEEDPLLETLDKVIPQDGAVSYDPSKTSGAIEPLPGLDVILKELLLEEGVDDVKISRQGFEKRVVSQDLQLWLSNAPPVNRMFTLLARAGRQVQEIQLTTTLDQDGVKSALQRVLERVP